MGVSGEWRLARDRVVESGGAAGPHFRTFYELAVRDGVRVLASKWKYSPAEARDLVHDVLAHKLVHVLAAESPRAMFLTLLTNHAVGRHRRRQREASLEAPDLHASGDAPPDQTAEARERLEEVEACFAALVSPRDRRVFSAVAVLGVPVPEVARAEALSEANVHQIVSRTRRRLKEGLDEGS
ncbi:MAG: sigma-70 family RNA polymerase sigma factor [Sandaracinaceae bacterium]|nr:sigma-70 family RNA polymerase sigma factor [Sandaracinaceae bacterium]